VRNIPIPQFVSRPTISFKAVCRLMRIDYNFTQGKYDPNFTRLTAYSRVLNKKIQVEFADIFFQDKEQYGISHIIKMFELEKLTGCEII
jgi:hypothetical protein